MPGGSGAAGPGGNQAHRAEQQAQLERDAANTKALHAAEELRREHDLLAADRDRLRDEVAAVRSEQSPCRPCRLAARKLVTNRDWRAVSTSGSRMRHFGSRSIVTGSRKNFNRFVPNSRPDGRGRGSAACLGSWKLFTPTAIGLRPSGSKRRARPRRLRSRLEELERSLAAAIASQEKRRDPGS